MYGCVDNPNITPTCGEFETQYGKDTFCKWSWAPEYCCRTCYVDNGTSATTTPTPTTPAPSTTTKATTTTTTTTQAPTTTVLAGSSCQDWNNATHSVEPPCDTFVPTYGASVIKNFCGSSPDFKSYCCATCASLGANSLHYILWQHYSIKLMFAEKRSTCVDKWENCKAKAFLCDVDEELRTKNCPRTCGQC